jgi:hypothetical protein
MFAGTRDAVASVLDPAAWVSRNDFNVRRCTCLSLRNSAMA